MPISTTTGVRPLIAFYEGLNAPPTHQSGPSAPSPQGDPPHVSIAPTTPVSPLQTTARKAPLTWEDVGRIGEWDIPFFTQNKVSPDDYMAWEEAGVSEPDDIIYLTNKKVTPDAYKLWKEAGVINLHDIGTFCENNVSLDTYKSWKEVGIVQTWEITSLQKDGVTPDEYKLWQKSDVTEPSFIAFFKERGITPEEYSIWYNDVELSDITKIIKLSQIVKMLNAKPEFSFNSNMSLYGFITHIHSIFNIQPDDTDSKVTSLSIPGHTLNEGDENKIFKALQIADQRAAERAAEAVKTINEGTNDPSNVFEQLAPIISGYIKAL